MVYLPTTNTRTVVLPNREPSASLTSRTSMRTWPEGWVPTRVIAFANVPLFPGMFAAPIRFLAGAGGPGRIEVVDMRQSDRSAPARVSVQVRLEASAARRPGLHQPVPQQIVIETPVSGATVGMSVELRGWIGMVPFENNLTYRVYSDGGAVIDRGWIMVEGDLGLPESAATAILPMPITPPRASYTR